MYCRVWLVEGSTRGSAWGVGCGKERERESVKHCVLLHFVALHCFVLHYIVLSSCFVEAGKRTDRQIDRLIDK